MKTIEFNNGAVWLIDQTQLPLNPVTIECRHYEQVAGAIKGLKVRGAPAIGLAAAYGAVLAARELARSGTTPGGFRVGMAEAIRTLRATRPTAVNLFWALDRVQTVLDEQQDAPACDIADGLLQMADEMLREDEETNRAMGKYGADLIPDGSGILTHCNTGALATGAFGTALGAIRSAYEQGKRLHVWVDETRPLLQGARLTTWELKEAGIPFTLITDSMAGHFMAQGAIDLAMVGADRVVANGDAANKIGTYGAAVLARAHEIPFYFVAPTSTIDLATASGADITIEERRPEEVAAFGGVRVAPHDIDIANPAFDVTPSRLISAIVTERGVVTAPFAEGLKRVAGYSVKPVESLPDALAGADAV